MSDITFTSEMPVELVQYVGSDDMIAAAARVSTGNDILNEVTLPEKQAGLINYLVKARHGSPFEHGSMTFRIEAPIFVWREFMRHRIASYNESSARYRRMEPKFYRYPHGRPLVQAGSGAHPKLVDGGDTLFNITTEVMDDAAIVAWGAYQALLTAGAANEVARAVLPVSIFSSAYVTMNPRALMSFLSLRVDSPDAAYATKPQLEIQKVAEQMEAIFAEKFPLTHKAFVKNKRVAP